MLTNTELETLWSDLESDRVERKKSVSDRDKIRQAICAFANDMPDHRKSGVVFVGQNDDGSCANIAITDELLKTLADMRSNGNILPVPVMSVQKRTVCGCELAVIAVEPSAAPPVRFRGRTWIRIGPQRGIATAEEEKRLAERRRGRDLPFELIPVSGASPSDLDVDAFERTYLPAAVAGDVLEENNRTLDEQLTGLRFLTPSPEFTPTVLGMLALGTSACDFVPGAYVQFLRVDGTDLSDPIKDQKAVSGPLLDMLRELDTILDSHVSIETDLTSGPVEKQSPDYPVAALQQLLRNAILHRTYEFSNAPVRFYWFADRIEILSPGGPFGQVSAANFGQPGITDYRNRHLAEVMRNLGYVQRFGAGIAIARKQCEKNGNPPPEFAVEETHVLATVRRRP